MWILPRHQLSKLIRSRRLKVRPGASTSQRWMDNWKLSSSQNKACHVRAAKKLQHFLNKSFGWNFFVRWNESEWVIGLNHDLLFCWSIYRQASTQGSISLVTSTAPAVVSLSSTLATVVSSSFISLGSSSPPLVVDFITIAARVAFWEFPFCASAIKKSSTDENFDIAESFTHSEPPVARSCN